MNLFQAKVETEEYRIIAELALALVLFTDASKANIKVLESNIGLPLTIVFGVLRRKANFKVELLESAEGAGDTFSLITWLIFGFLVIASFIHELSWQVALYAVLSLTIIRMLPVFIALIRTDLSGNEKAFMGWPLP